MSAIALDPLIAEAKQRRRRRRLLALGGAVVVAAAVATPIAVRAHGSERPLALRAQGNSLGVCAKPPPGWQKKSVWEMSFGPQSLGLTNFRFGLVGDPDAYGLTSYARRPAGSVTIAVDAGSPMVGAQPRFKRSLRVTRDDFSFNPYGVMQSPSAYIATHTHGRERTAVVEVGAVTSATLAVANRALASVHTCSA